MKAAKLAVFMGEIVAKYGSGATVLISGSDLFVLARSDIDGPYVGRINLPTETFDWLDGWEEA